MASQPRLIRLNFLIIVLVSHGQCALGRSGLRDEFTNEDLDMAEPSAEAPEIVGDDQPLEPDNGDLMYDAVLETMALVRQVLDVTKAQGLQLKEIQARLQQQQDQRVDNSDCSDEDDEDLSLIANFPWASLFPEFPGTSGYFPQRERKRNLKKSRNSSNHRLVRTNSKRAAPPPLFPPETHPPPWIGYRSQHRQLDFGPPPNGPADDPDLSIHNSQNPSPEGVYPPSGGYSEQRFPSPKGRRAQRRQLDFGPSPNGPADDPDLSMHNSQNPPPEGVYPPSGGYSEQRFPSAKGRRAHRRQFDAGSPPNGPSNDPDVLIEKIPNPSPEGAHPQSGGYPEQPDPLAYF